MWGTILAFSDQVERWSVLENESMKQTSDSETPPTQSSKKNEVTLVRHKSECRPHLLYPVVNFACYCYTQVNFELVRNGQVSIEGMCVLCNSAGELMGLFIDVCIGCGSMGVVAEQPLFHGGYCKDCKVRENLLSPYVSGDFLTVNWIGGLHGVCLSV